MKEHDFEEARIRAYGKGELAQMYYPNCTLSWALRLFQADLERAPGLTDALRRWGWTPRQRLLRHAWVRLIFDGIGPP